MKTINNNLKVGLLALALLLPGASLATAASDVNVQGQPGTAIGSGAPSNPADLNRNMNNDTLRNTSDTLNNNDYRTSPNTAGRTYSNPNNPRDTNLDASPNRP